MTGDDDSEKTSGGFPTSVPTAFGMEVTLSPNEIKTFSVTSDVDLMLTSLAAHADGPAIVRLRISDTPSPDRPRVHLSGESFGEYLEKELPVHLARQVGENLNEWVTKNEQLYQAAWEGDDETYFELLERDPRTLQSEMTVRRVLTWRTEIERFNSAFRFKASRFWVREADATNASHRMEQARTHLRRIGESLFKLYDQRGKRPLPPAGHVRGIYYGLLCLLNGLRATYREKNTGTQHRPTQIEKHLSALVEGIAALHDKSSFLFYIIAAAQLVTDTGTLAKTRFKNETLSSLVGGEGRGMMPSDTARSIASAAFDVSPDTVERLCAQNTPIPLESSEDELCVLVGRPTYKLFDFHEIQTLKLT